MRLARIQRYVLITGIVFLALANLVLLIMLRRTTWVLSPREFDLLLTLPADYWIWLVAGTLVGFLTLLSARSEAELLGCLVGIVLLYGPGFLLGHYPAVAGWDSFLHATPARALIEEQRIPASNLYATQYPGAPALLAVFAGITRLSAIDAAILITIAGQLALTLIFFAIARIFLAPRASAWATLAIVAATPAILTNEHYSPWFLSYIINWMMVLMLAKIITTSTIPNWIPLHLSLLLLGGNVIISHPFQPMIIVSFVIGLAIWAQVERSERAHSIWWLTMLLLVAISSWIVFIATPYLRSGLLSFWQAIMGTQDVVDTWVAMSPQEVLRRASPPALALMLVRGVGYAGLGLLALAGLLLRSRRREAALLLGLAVLSTSGALIGFSSEAPWLQRFLYFVPPLLAIGAALTLSQAGLWKRGFWSATATICAALIMPVSLLLWHPPSLIYSLHPQQAGFLVWPQEHAATSWVAKQTEPESAVASDLQTMIVYSYAEPDVAPWAHGVSMGSNLHAKVKEQPLLFDGTWIIRSGRQELSSYGAQDIGSDFWTALDTRLSSRGQRVYDNGFVTVHHIVR